MTCYHIDAFTSEIFKGNPAAVCITNEPLLKELMQKIAAENNLSETAFVVPNGEIYSLRWFTLPKDRNLSIISFILRK